MKELQFQSKEEARVACERMRKVYGAERVDYLSDAIERHPYAKLILGYLKLKPPTVEVAAIHRAVLREGVTCVITSPECKFVDAPDVSHMFSGIMCRQRILEALVSGTDVKPSREGAAARGETRAREDNKWLIEKQVASQVSLWKCCVLPKGRRCVAAFISGEPGKAYLFNRSAVADVPEVISATGPTDCAFDCILTPEGHLIAFDAIYVNGNCSVCSLPLGARLAAATAAGMKVCSYEPAENAATIARRITRESGERLLLVLEGSQYRPNLRSAVIWKPPFPGDTAVFCIRIGKAMALASRDDVVLCVAGDVSGMPDGDWHMKSFVCRYNAESNTWIPLELAKRKEPLSTWEQAYDIMSSGSRVVADGVEIFRRLSTSLKK